MNYYLHNGELYPTDELRHWKYIKREKQADGKYKYWYDLGETQKKNYEQAKSNYDNYRKQNKSANVKRITNTKDLSDSDKPKEHVRDYYSWAREDKLKSTMKKAKTEYSKTPLAKREQRAEKTKQSINKVKNWAKDVVGYDEKDAAKKAQMEAKLAKYDAEDTAKKNAEWKAKNPSSRQTRELADWQDNYKSELAAEAETKAQEALEKYKKTPLAMVESVADKVKDVVGVDELEAMDKAYEKYDELNRAAATYEKQFRKDMSAVSDAVFNMLTLGDGKDDGTLRDSIKLAMTTAKTSTQNSMELETAQDEYAKAREKAGKTLLGRLKTLRDNPPESATHTGNGGAGSSDYDNMRRAFLRRYGEEYNLNEDKFDDIIREHGGHKLTNYSTYYNPNRKTS